jgi:acetolactate synthase I/II/III large subunit
MDIFSIEVDTSLFARLAHHTQKLVKPSLDEVVAEKIVRTIAEAHQPVIYAGGGVLLADAAEELRAFATHFSIPVAHSLMGKGALPDDHALTLGMTGFWGTQFVNDKCRQADWVLGLGTRFAEADCSSWESEFTFSFPPTKLIHIDIDPSEIGRNYPADIGVVTDLKQALVVLNRVAARLYPQGRRNDALVQEIARYRADFVQGNQANVTSDAYPMQPERILAAVREVLPRDAIITTDVGWNKNGVGQQFPVYTPGSILTPGGFATMGFGAPAALGAKLACPDKVVVALVGDGGFGQNPAMLATAVESNIPVVWVVMNNYAFGTIAGLQKAHYGTTIGCVFQKDGEPYSADFAAVARAYGAEGVKVQSAEEFKQVLQRATTSNRPFVIDVAMLNNPVPTAGHWNIMDIYSPGKRVTHAST